MKKIEKMIHQIIRFRGNIEAFLVSIEEFSRSTYFTSILNTSGGIYGVSGISMDIPEISMFHKQVTLCHQSGDIL